LYFAAFESLRQLYLFLNDASLSLFILLPSRASGSGSYVLAVGATTVITNLFGIAEYDVLKMEAYFSVLN